MENQDKIYEDKFLQEGRATKEMLEKIQQAKKTKEEELRKCTSPPGVWLKLGDGEKWCISALPLGRIGDEILDKIEKVFKFQKEKEEEDTTTEEDTIRLRGYLRVGADFAYTLLKVNYPGLTFEYFEDQSLVTISNINTLVIICQGGSVLGDLIPESDLTEAKKKD